MRKGDEPKPMIGIPRGQYFGKRLGDPPQEEAEHFTPVSGVQRLDRLP
jgi:hypothetical protein